MKRLWMLMLWVGLAAQGAIVESGDMVGAMASAPADTLVVFDLDNTLVQSAQTVGSVQWHDWYTKELVKKGLPGSEAGELSIREWVRVFRASEGELVDPRTPALIRSLQTRGVKVLALTARPVAVVRETLVELSRKGIRFDRSWPAHTRFQTPFPGTAYSHGVLFAGQTQPKGGVLKEFLRQNSVRPRAVRFADDKRKYLESVEGAMVSKGIPFLGIRYSGADARVKGFDAGLAAFQTEYFQRYGVVLSDSRARSLMGGRTAVGYQSLSSIGFGPD